MGSSGPKKQDYQPTEAEKINASVAQARSDWFRQNYDPLNLENMKRSLTENTRTTLRGRASADAFQTLTKAPSLNNVTSIDAAGDLSGAISGQLQTADAAAKGFQNEKQANVLGIAQDQADVASEGLANVARIERSKLLQAAEDKQMVRGAKAGALGQIATALILTGADKYKTAQADKAKKAAEAAAKKGLPGG